MAGNIFSIHGEKVDTQEAFFERFTGGEENKGELSGAKISKVLFFGDTLESSGIKVFKKTSFKNISFKDTSIKNYKFIECDFNRCLFLNTNLIGCDFGDCKFKDCNFSDCKLDENSRIDPQSLKDNFNFNHDANLATKFFHHLYDIYSDVHQPEYQRDAKYFFLKSKRGLTHYYFTCKRIGKPKHYYNIFSSKLADFISGYGVYKLRIVRTLLIYLLLMASINYYILVDSFSQSDCSSIEFIDALYFTFVMVTTIGFGDITPNGDIGQWAVMLESGAGIFLIAYSLNIFTGSDK